MRARVLIEITKSSFDPVIINKKESAQRPVSVTSVFKLLFAFESLGSKLYGEIGDLGKYKLELSNLAKHSTLAQEVPEQQLAFGSSADTLLELIRVARNDASAASKSAVEKVKNAGGDILIE